MLLNNYSVIRFIIIISAIFSIEFFCYIGSISPLQLTAPSKMVMTLYEFMYEQSFWFQARKTVKNIIIAILLASFLGFLIGLILFRFQRLRRASEPIIASYILPFFVLYPIAIVIVGMNDFSIILMGFAYALVAMITNTLSGLDRVPNV